MYKEHDVIVLTKTFCGVKKGSKGTIVHVHANHKAYEVEFLDEQGSSRVITLSEFRFVKERV